MIVTILVHKIISLFLILFAGFFLVRFKFMDVAQSRGISEISLFLITPCVLITAFQIEYSDSLRDGLILGLIAAILVHIGLIALTYLFSRLFHFRNVEIASIIYTNAGNLIIPLVVSILGPEWVIYTCSFMAVQTVLMWTHGRAIVKGETSFNFVKIFLNINMLSIFCGFALFLLDIKIWSPLKDAMDSLGIMIGPCAMLVAGMLIGKMQLKDIISFKRLPLVILMRLLFLPSLMLLLLLGLGYFASDVPNAHAVLLVTLLATVAPSASTIVQMAQVYDSEPQYASAINVANTLTCIITIPIFVMFYEMFATI